MRFSLSPIQSIHSNMRFLLSPIHCGGRKQFPTPFSVFRCHTMTNSLNRKISDYVRNGNVDYAHKLFDEFPDSRNTVSWNTLINGYIRIRQFTQAQKLFDEMPHRNVVSWNTLISGYRKAHNPEKAYHHFLRMMGDGGVRPDEFTFSVIMMAVLKNTKFNLLVPQKFNVLVPQLHGLVFRLGLDRYNYLESTLMMGYIGLGDRDGFRRVFDEVSVKHVVVCNLLMIGYAKFGWINEVKISIDSMQRRDVALDIMALMSNGCTFSSALHACTGYSSLAMRNQLHACLLKFGIPLGLFLGNNLVDMYVKSGDIDAAFRVFGSMTTKNMVSWNSIIGAYARHGLANRALEEFQRMIMSGTLPNQISLINVLKACAHGGKVKEAEAIFNSMESEYGVQAQMEHYSCMVDLYGRAGLLDKADEVITTMPFEANVVVWNANITGCMQYMKFERALHTFGWMMSLSKCKPDRYTFSSVLSACSGLSLGRGKQVHAFILKSDIPLEMTLGNSLVDMYAECGDMEAAYRVFESMTRNNLVSWNSIIGGYARHGPADRALEEFERMIIMGDTHPDGITFINVLLACVSGGKVKEAEAIFDSMEGEYGVLKEMEHYSCMMKLYGKAGQLEKARAVIKMMPFEPVDADWWLEE